MFKTTNSKLLDYARTKPLAAIGAVLLLIVLTVDIARVHNLLEVSR